MADSTTSSPAAEFIPADADARSTIVEQLDRTLFVEASAGTGKTTSLVDRVVNLVATGTTTLDRIAAITFTEAAAAELRDRVRQRLEQAADDEGRDGTERQRCRQGAADLDQAAIRTLHSFAAQLLHERPLEAGLPPGFDTTDEIAAGIKFNDAWGAWLNDALEGKTALAADLAAALTLGMRPDDMRGVALEFHRNYADLRTSSFPRKRESIEAPATSAAPLVPSPSGGGLGWGRPLDSAHELERLCDFARLGSDDPLVAHVHSKLPSLRRIASAEPGTPASLRLLTRLLPLSSGRGNRTNWDVDPISGDNACSALKASLKELHDAAIAEVAQARHTCLLPVLDALRDFALDYVAQRRAEGRAEFHDLLIWARDLLRDNLEVRDHFRHKFSHVLIDEAQDTDPIQTEIAMFLAESVPSGTAAESRPTYWQEIVPETGKLFVVGDPKQSIYRFRRADVAQMVQLQRLLEQSGGSMVSLVQNFRSQANLVNWVNHVFSRWMGEETGDSDDLFKQARYEEMHPRWQGKTGSSVAPQVWALSNVAEESKIGPVREQESQDIAALIREMVAGQWPVLDEAATRQCGDETYRPASYSDICILMPRRTALRTLERSLETADIPFRLESASLVFETQEIRDLLNCLRAIDNPADQVAAVAALRSPAFGCSDVELLLHHGGGGSFNCLAESGEQPPGPVTDSLSALRRYHEDRHSGSSGALIDRFVRERMLLEVAIDHPRTREQWRRYRFMVERAWQFESAGGRSLREYVQWVDDQINERARVTEAAVPETDEDAVRVMTVHAAKGLEFPVVILTGINSDYGGRVGKVLYDRRRGRMEVRMGSRDAGFETPGFAELEDSEKRMSDAEDVRLMYVAATRARDHLVLSLRRTAGGRGSRSAAATMAELMEGHPALWTEVSPRDDRPLEPPETEEPEDRPDAASQFEHSVEALESWRSGREALFGEMGRPSSIAATSLGRTKQIEPEDKPEQESSEPWKRGRAGMPVGKAVHAVLQSIDLATGEGIADRARAQAAAEGVPGREEEIERLCRVAVDSGIVKRAVASKRFWREVPVAVGTGNGSLHGFIDLLFEEEEGLVVVDYKTDSITGEEAPESVQRYRLQGGAYAHALQELTGKPVTEVVFLYLQPRREQQLPDLPGAMREAREEAAKLLGAQSG